MKLIRRTEISKPDTTYNLHIKDDHNYVAAGAVVANCHSAKANELRNLLTGPMAHIPIRWGVTGTLPKAEHEAVALLASIGPAAGELRAADLQERGVLANCQIQIVQTADEVEFADYESEHRYLVRDRDRLEAIARMIEDWADTGNTLVLVDQIETGEALKALLCGATFVNGKTNGKNRKAEYNSVQTAHEKILIATYGVAAVGINIPRLFNIVLIEAGQSFIRVIQSIGRGLRKAKDKDNVRIYDVCSTAKFSKRHLSKRKEFYKEAEYPFTMVKMRR